jgi:D-3-phosphoglycerate dehydrogenase
MANTWRVQTLNAISGSGLARFPQHYAVGADLDTPDALLLRSAPLHGVPIPESVLAIARAGAGVNNIPVAVMSARGVPVFNAPGANANAVKELVLASLLLAARNLVPALRFVDQLSGPPDVMHAAVEAGKKPFAGIELPGRTLGIIGLGAVGSRVAEGALALGMSVVGFDPAITVEAAWRLPSMVRQAKSVEEVLRAADFVTLHVPLLDSTRHLIDARSVEFLRLGAGLLNFSRDGVVDNRAVIDALDRGRLSAYLCDFPAAELITHPRVVCLPHLGASTREAEENCAIMAAEQLVAYLEHGTIRNAVNFPAVDMPRESGFRLTIAHANVPNMVSAITSTLAAANLNIHNMLNKSRGELAYSLVDIDTPPESAVVTALRTLDGVLAVRDLRRER